MEFLLRRYGGNMDRTIELLCRFLTWIGGSLMLLAIIITVGDVIARALFKTGYIGIVDITQFAVIGFAYMAMPLAFLKNEHVAIGLYDHRLGKKADLLLRMFANVLAQSVLLIIIYYGWTQASRTVRYGDVSQNVEIPMILFWVMILGGCFVSLLVCALQFIKNLLNFLGREVENA